MLSVAYCVRISKVPFTTNECKIILTKYYNCVIKNAWLQGDYIKLIVMYFEGKIVGYLLHRSETIRAVNLA